MSAAEWRPFQRTSSGTYLVALGADDREVLRVLPIQLNEALTTHPNGEVFKRLHPPAYANDDQAEKEYRELIGPGLDESKAAALAKLVETADATELSAEEMDSWARALNDIRLWLGTVLNVGQEEGEEETDDPPYLLYHALTYLQGSVIDALSGQ